MTGNLFKVMIAALILTFGAVFQANAASISAPSKIETIGDTSVVQVKKHGYHGRKFRRHGGFKYRKFRGHRKYYGKRKYWRGKRYRHGRKYRRYYYYGYPYAYYGYYDYPPYPYYRYRRAGRCAYWHRRCKARWGYGSNYRGCMKYHRCRP